ncbi:MAG: PPC domain-containing DNA-binding protein [Pseudomonadota bacterium]
MESTTRGDLHFLRLDRGEDVAASITAYCDEAGIRSAAVSGIGAIEDVEIGFYDLAARQYLKRRLEGIYELISLAGNITRVDGRAFMHAHVTLGARDFTVTGGHLFGGKIAVTGEIFLAGAGMALTREMNDEIGLKLITM